MPLKLAATLRETVAGHRLGALEGGTPPPASSNASREGGLGHSPQMLLLSQQLAAAIEFSPLAKIHQSLCAGPPVLFLRGLGGGGDCSCPTAHCKALAPTAPGSGGSMMPTAVEGRRMALGR